jgi:hypothetical protein
MQKQASIKRELDMLDMQFKQSQADFDIVKISFWTQNGGSLFNLVSRPVWSAAISFVNVRHNNALCAQCVVNHYGS